MGRRLTAEMCRARYQAFSEAADHLGLDWTDDDTELAQVEFCQRAIRKLADEWHTKAILRTPLSSPNETEKTDG